MNELSPAPAGGKAVLASQGLFHRFLRLVCDFLVVTVWDLGLAGKWYGSNLGLGPSRSFQLSRVQQTPTM